MTIARALRVRVECPRCRADVRIPTTTGVCPSCRLRIRIQVEEPRCTCGYALYQLQGDCCPECGRDVPLDQQWNSRGVEDDQRRAGDLEDAPDDQV